MSLPIILYQLNNKRTRADTILTIKNLLFLESSKMKILLILTLVKLNLAQEMTMV